MDFIAQFQGQIPSIPHEIYWAIIVGLATGGAAAIARLYSDNQNLHKEVREICKQMATVISSNSAIIEAHTQIIELEYYDGSKPSNRKRVQQ